MSQHDVPIEDFYTFLTPYAANAPDDVIDHAIREAVIWFCRESRMMEDEVSVHFQRNVHDYMLDIPEDREIIALDWTREYLHNLHRGAHVNIAHHFIRDIFGVGYFRPTWHKDGIHPVVEFRYAPVRGGERKLWYSWSPKRDFCAAPRVLYEEWMECVRHKALYFLYSMPGTEWFNMEAAMQNEQSAEKWVAKARTRRYLNYTQQNKRLRAQPFVGRNGWYYGGSTYYGGGV